jgi:hypothetical protein
MMSGDIFWEQPAGKPGHEHKRRIRAHSTGSVQQSAGCHNVRIIPDLKNGDMLTQKSGPRITFSLSLVFGLPDELRDARLKKSSSTLFTCPTPRPETLQGIMFLG